MSTSQQDGNERGGSPDDEVVSATNLAVSFRGAGKSVLHALDGVSLTLTGRETLAVVGESGSGKTTLARALVQLQPLSSGTVRVAGRELTALRGRELRLARKPIQMVFQDPFSSLDPRMTIEDIVAEPLTIGGVPRSERRLRVRELLNLVGLPDDAANRLPREFSGGQRQRIGIARALAADPKVIVCDEPLSALDVSIQAQIVNLLVELQQRLGIAYIFISHDLAIVRQIASRVAVMYLGRIVELSRVEDLFMAPRHPYTLALLLSVPALTDAFDSPPHLLVSGDPPSPLERPAGCRFRTRCWLRAKLGDPEACETLEPAPANDDGDVSCHFADRTLAHLDEDALGRLRLGANHA